MPVDFTELLHKLASQKFKSLWPAQSQVLESYAASHWATKDLSVELPTGAGKTLIALLVAEARRAEGKKVAVLCGRVLVRAERTVSEAIACTEGSAWCR
jgi:superfamily II DNA or RNA helicase